MNTGDIILKVENLSIGFESDGRTVAITDDVSFEVRAGEMFGLVGESGCGKTVTCLALLKLLPTPGGRVISGRILFQGRDILRMDPPSLQKIRGEKVGMIFQEPGAALNPLLTVQQQLQECFRYHPYNGDHRERMFYLLKRVGFADPQRTLNMYPHELSGGMRQRIMIAMALTLNPDLLIADEPTTAVDVTIQSQIMELLVGLQDEFRTAIILVTHNLNLIAQYAHQLAVMYAGRIVEHGAVPDFVRQPLHPYSVGLLAALPDLHSESRDLRAIPGQVPRPADYAPGCCFRERCPYAFEACIQRPGLLARGDTRVACHLYDPAVAAAHGKERIIVRKEAYAAPAGKAAR